MTIFSGTDLCQFIANQLIEFNDEVIFLDRLVKQADEPKESFNRKLAIYLKTHPEVMPPGAEKAEPKPKATVGRPPKF